MMRIRGAKASRRFNAVCLNANANKREELGDVEIRRKTTDVDPEDAKLGIPSVQEQRESHRKRPW
jgi:hypothetical protein